MRISDPCHPLERPVNPRPVNPRPVNLPPGGPRLPAAPPTILWGGSFRVWACTPVVQ